MSVTPVTNVSSNLTLKTFGNSHTDPVVSISRWDSTLTTPAEVVESTFQATGSKELTVGVSDVLKLPGSADSTSGATPSTAHKIVLGNAGRAVEIANVDTVAGESGSETHTHTLDISETTRLAENKNLVFNNQTAPQSISGKLQTYSTTVPSGSGATTAEDPIPAGVQFTADAGFIIPNPKHVDPPEEGQDTRTDLQKAETVNVRISDLFGDGDNLEVIANVLSAVCRRVYALEHYTGTASPGAAPTDGGEVQDTTPGTTFNGDKHWIKYFANQNLDSGNSPDHPVTP